MPSNKTNGWSRVHLYVALLLGCLPAARVLAEPPPNPPLLATAPNPAAWTIDVQHKKPRAALPADPTEAALRKRLMDSYPLLLRETVEKAGGNWHHVKYYDNQRKDDIWVYHGMVAYVMQNFAADRVAAVPVSAVNSPVRSGFGPDFPELGWIDGKYFVGTVDYGGVRCHLYRTDKAKSLTGGDELTPGSGTTALSAWIDAGTRLPLAVESDDMVKRYSYHTGSSDIQPAGIFAEALRRAMPDAKTGAQ